MASENTTEVIDIEGRQLKLSHLDKVFYPQTGFTKGQLIDYYTRIAPVLLPHLKARALTLKRYPDGVEGSFFYEKNCPSYRPEWMKTVKVWSKSNRKYMSYCVVEDLPSLIWLANLADIELHTSLARTADVGQPTLMVFDLDPGPPASMVDCCQVAVWIRDILARLKLQAFPKTSGSKGLQIYVPLNTTVTYDRAKSFAHRVANLLVERHPDHVVSDMKKSLRGGKVLVDWSQNDAHKTTICAYSLRARERPTVSTPVTWVEVEDCWKAKNPEPLAFTSERVLERVKTLGDLFAPVSNIRQKLPALAQLKALESVPST